MSMTREEAIKYGENKLTLLGALGYNDYYTPGEYCGYYDEFSFVTVALSALRPITREQAERVRGEWVHTHSTDNFWTEVWKCSYCGYEDDNGDCFDFCPGCGQPKTDEAVETIMKRMEEMRND